MNYILILLCTTLLSACTLITNEQRDAIGASLKDINAAAAAIPESLPASAIAQHADAIAAAMRIDPDEYRARVSTDYWRAAPEAAHDESVINAKKTAATGEMSILNIALWGSAAVTGMLAVARVLTVVAPGNPLTGLLSMGVHMLGGNNPKKVELSNKVRDKTFDVLEEYKKIDPDWRKHWIYERLSATMTRPEKDYVKELRE